MTMLTLRFITPSLISTSRPFSTLPPITPSRLLDAYTASLSCGTTQPDPHQLDAVKVLSTLSAQLSSPSSSSAVRRKSMEGAYLYGGVGSGKTYVMDMFYETAPTTAKTRMHFTAFMAMIHEKMKMKQEERKGMIDQGLLQVRRTKRRERSVLLVCCLDARRRGLPPESAERASREWQDCRSDARCVACVLSRDTTQRSSARIS